MQPLKQAMGTRSTAIWRRLLHRPLLHKTHRPHLSRSPQSKPMPIRATPPPLTPRPQKRSEEHTSGLQSLMRISYAVFCLKKKKTQSPTTTILIDIQVKPNSLNQTHL